MKERLTGIGLVVGTALTLGVTWADSAQAFSLNSEVIVTNFLDKGELGRDIFQGPTEDLKVEDGTELTQFGGIWDIDLSNGSILFTLNSLFSNVASGNDVYRFQAPNFGRIGQDSVVGFQMFRSDGFSTDKSKMPFVVLKSGNELEVIFPIGFAPGGLTPPVPSQPNGSEPFQPLKLQVDLTIEPTPVPTPALLPGLLGMGLAILRRRCQHDSAE
jgi:hypothetical protein